MRRAIQFLPLLALAPLGDFLGFYLEGAGLLQPSTGFLISISSALLLPWAVAALFATARATWRVRLLLFIGALVVQGVLLFTIVPPGAISEMMGTAHRLRRAFPPDQMRACAATLRQKQKERALLVAQGDKVRDSLMSDKAVLVDDSELPALLRGRFDHVFIQPDEHTGEQQVYFCLNNRTGVLCDGRKHVREFFVCSMADGVHAYRYQIL